MAKTVLNGNRWKAREIRLTTAEEYLAAVTLSMYSWGSDLDARRAGLFSQRASEASTLRKIATFLWPKLEADWFEVQRWVTGNIAFSLITAAKNIAESLVLAAPVNAPGRMTWSSRAGWWSRSSR